MDTFHPSIRFTAACICVSKVILVLNNLTGNFSRRFERFSSPTNVYKFVKCFVLSLPEGGVPALHRILQESIEKDIREIEDVKIRELATRVFFDLMGLRDDFIKTGTRKCNWNGIVSRFEMARELVADDDQLIQEIGAIDDILNLSKRIHLRERPRRLANTLGLSLG